MNAPVTMPRERGISCSGPMVLQVLADAKTQTRRPIKNAEDVRWFGWPCDGDLGYAHPLRQCSAPSDGTHFHDRDGFHWSEMRCPYGVPGDRLWVREAWRTSVGCDDKPGSALEKPGGGFGWPVWYEADGGAVTWRGATGGGPSFTGRGRYRHARFMPRWASRITLDVLSIRVERLHDISDADILAEGVTYPVVEAMVGARATSAMTLHDCWRLAWTHIYSAESWGANPWLWVVGFRRVQP